jgi:hypothetical protein
VCTTIASTLPVIIPPTINRIEQADDVGPSLQIPRRIAELFDQDLAVTFRPPANHTAHRAEGMDIAPDMPYSAGGWQAERARLRDSFTICRGVSLSQLLPFGPRVGPFHRGPESKIRVIHPTPKESPWVRNCMLET